MGVVKHLGSSGESGHYIAYIRNLNTNQWYLFSDSVVSECFDLNDIYNNNNPSSIPYILLYYRLD